LGKSVTSAMTLAGTASGNYTLTQPTLTGDIMPLGITGHFVRQELESDETVKASVFRLVDDTHTTAPESFEDTVVRNGLAGHSRDAWPSGRFILRTEYSGVNESWLCREVTPGWSAILTLPDYERVARHSPVIGEQVPIELPLRRNAAAAPSRTPAWLLFEDGEVGVKVGVLPSRC